MRTLIYLPLIALIVLCSCKSNSFTKQRYTNFAHHSNKSKITKKQVNQLENTIAEPVETNVAEYPQLAGAAETGPVLFVKENLIKPLKSKLQSGDLKITKTENKEVENSKSEFKNKKTLQKQSSMAQRIIGTLLKIVLWIIILAVVVGVILIIGALA